MRDQPPSLALLVFAAALAAASAACESTPVPATPGDARPSPAVGAPPNGQPSAAPSAETSAPGATAEAPASPASTGGPAAPKPSAPVSRELSASATFRDLVRAARGAAGQASPSACLLRGGKAGQPATLEAPIDKAAGEISDPPADLDALLGKRRQQQPFPEDGLRALTSWGASEGGDYLDLMALSPASRAMSHAPTLMLIATDKGIYLGLSGRTSDGRPMTADERARLVKDVLPRAKVIVVAAEGDAPIARVREALEMVATTKGTVVLASPLAEAGPPRRRASRYDHKVEEGEPYACSRAIQGGVPGGSAGEYKMGSLSKLSDMVERATARCGEALGVGAGGAIHLMMRINAKGAIDEACAETDDTGSAELRACVLEATKTLKLPKPDKPGLITFGMAAVFTGKPVEPLCDP